MNIADELRKLQELRCDGALTDAEFAAAKAAVLANNTESSDHADSSAFGSHLEEIKRQNEVARVDREWELERENYMITGKHGHRFLPQRGMSVIGGVFIVGFGIFWTAMAASAGGGVGGVFVLFPLFGVLFILMGVGMSIYSYSKATQYEQAYQRYQHRRARLMDDPLHHEGLGEN